MQNWVFWGSLDNLLKKKKKRNCFLLWKSKFKMGIFDLLYSSHVLVIREKLQKFFQQISHSHTYMYFAHIDFLLPYQF